jgi:hypothetical protein
MSKNFCTGKFKNTLRPARWCGASKLIGWLRIQINSQSFLNLTRTLHFRDFCVFTGLGLRCGGWLTAGTEDKLQETRIGEDGGTLLFRYSHASNHEFVSQ